MSFLGWIGKTLIGGVTGFVTGGPAGAVIGGATAAFGGGSGAGSTGGGVRPASPLGGSINVPMIGGTFRGLAPSGPWMPGTGPGPSPGSTSLPAPVPPSVSPAAAGGALVCNVRGFHLNKSRYFVGNQHWWQSSSVGTKVEKGSRCVKNRHMNVANAKALRRALRRAYGFEKLAMRTIRLVHPHKRGRFGGFKRTRARR